MEGCALRIDIMGVGFDPVDLPQAVERARTLLAQGGGRYVVTPNPELVERAAREPDFRAALNGADLVLADGVGVIYAARLLGAPLTRRVPGIDFAQALCAQLARTGERLFLLGAKPGVAQAAAERLSADYPGLTVCGTHHGYFSPGEEGEVAALVRRAGAQVVFVCLGAPGQEYWMARYGAESGAGLLVGLGGSLDVFAGQVKRAPEGWRRLGLEWLYRLLSQPSRIGRMAKLPLFLVRAAGTRLRGGGFKPPQARGGQEAGEE